MHKFWATVLLFGMSMVLVHAQGPAAKLDGTWLMTGVGADNKIPPEIGKAKVKLIMKNGEYEQNVGGTKLESGKFKFDPAKTTGAIDFEIREGKDKGKTQPAIFKLEGDKLVLAFGKPGQAARPKNFQATDDIDVVFFKREK